MARLDHVLRLVDEEVAINAATTKRRAPYLRVNGEPWFPTPRRQFLTLEMPDETIPLEYLSEGDFADVYQDGSDPPRVFAFVSRDNDDKDIAEAVYAEAEDSPAQRHLPAVRRVGSLKNRKVFEMPFYKTLQNHRASKEVVDAAQVLVGCGTPPATPEDAIFCAGIHLDPPLVEALGSLMKKAKARDRRYVFDLLYKNLAVDEDGNLILLDVLYKDDE